jgi:hypothetical protein
VDRPKAEALAQILFAAYPSVPLREGTEAVYIKFLLTLDEPAAKKAIDELLLTSGNLPSIAAIRTRVSETRLELPSASEAFFSLFDRGAELHPLTRYVALILGGVYNIRTSEVPGATRSQFLTLYQDIRADVIRSGELPKRARELADRASAPPAEIAEEAWEGRAAHDLEDIDDSERDSLFAEAAESLATAYLLRPSETSKFGLPAPLVRGEAIRLLAIRNGYLPPSPAAPMEIESFAASRMTARTA